MTDYITNSSSHQTQQNQQYNQHQIHKTPRIVGTCLSHTTMHICSYSNNIPHMQKHHTHSKTKQKQHTLHTNPLTNISNINISNSITKLFVNNNKGHKAYTTFSETKHWYIHPHSSTYPPQTFLLFTKHSL